MNSYLIILFSIFFAQISFVTGQWTASKRLSVYFTSWSIYERNFFVKDIPINRIADVTYAFFGIEKPANSAYYLPVSLDPWADYQKPFSTTSEGVTPLDPTDGRQGLFGNFGQFKKLKDAGAKFKLIISIGGWSHSKNFSIAMSTDSNRRAFSKALVDMNKQWSFIDGWSIDWEFPCSGSGQNYGIGSNTCSKDDGRNLIIFLKQLRADLNAANIGYKLITMAVTANPWKVTVPTGNLTNELDELHLLTYDYYDGDWGDKTTRHQTNVMPYHTAGHSINASVSAYLKQGYPISKMMVGAAYYSRGFSNTAGINTAANGGAGMVDYRNFPPSGYNEYFDNVAKAYYIYSASKRQFISADAPLSIKAKCDYVKSKGLLGIFAWEIGKDKVYSNAASLTRIMYNQFHNVANDPMPTWLGSTPGTTSPVSETPRPTSTSSSRTSSSTRTSTTSTRTSTSSTRTSTSSTRTSTSSTRTSTSSTRTSTSSTRTSTTSTRTSTSSTRISTSSTRTSTSSTRTSTTSTRTSTSSTRTSTSSTRTSTTSTRTSTSTPAPTTTPK